MSTNNAWYVRSLKEEAIKGPFPSGQITQEILLGRYTIDDEVSHDKEEWLTIGEVDDLLPTILKNDIDDPEREERLAAARRWADERRGDVQKKGASYRRSNEDGVSRVHSEIAETKNGLVSSCVQMSLVFVVVATLIVLAFQYSPQKIEEADCSASAKQGVNWKGCNLTFAQLFSAELVGSNLMSTNLQKSNLVASNFASANLKYAQLQFANLQQAKFSQADLVGANLSGADLSSAVFDNADLSYANFKDAIIIDTVFTNARLDNAIWIDGRTCGKNSIGSCQ